MVVVSENLEAVTEPVQLCMSNLDLPYHWQDEKENLHCNH